MICRHATRLPWPVSIAPLRAVTLPSAAILSHESRRFGGGLPTPVPARAAARASVPALCASDGRGRLQEMMSAPPPFSRSRRVNVLSSRVFAMVVPSGHRRSGALNGSDDAQVRATPTEVAVHCLADLQVG